MFDNRALLLVGKNKFKVEKKIIENSVEEGEVLIKVLASGVCGSDLTYSFVSNHTVEKPAVLGHEIVGEIVKVGRLGDNGFQIGERVVVDAGVSCGICEFCKENKKNLCPDTIFYGYPPFDGGFQNFVKVKSCACFRLPADISIENGILIEPLAVSLHSIKVAKIKKNMNVAIIGQGPIGLMTTKILAFEHSLQKIVTFEKYEHKRTLSLAYGASESHNVSEIAELEIKQSKNKYSNYFDVVFEACGDYQGLNFASDLVKPGGKLIMIGIPKKDDMGITHTICRKKGINLKFIRRLGNSFAEALSTISKYDFEQMITHKFDLDQAVTGILLNQKYEDGIIKSLVCP